MADEGRKREFVIEADEKTAATLQDEPRYFSDIKPKKRHLVDVIYEETGEVAQTKRGAQCKLILKTSVYNDGVTVDTTVGEDNEGYQTFLKTGVSMPQDSGGQTTLVRKRSAKVEAALKKAKGEDKKAPAKKEA